VVNSNCRLAGKGGIGRSVFSGLAAALGMQRIYETELTPDQYYQTQAHREVICESVCPRCGQADGLHSHGTYARWITDLLGKLWRILIARFLCPGCRRTVSYLPHFALSYRPIQSPTVEAFFEGERDRRDVQTWLSVLRHYPQCVEAFAPEVIRTVGAGWHGPPCSVSAERSPLSFATLRWQCATAPPNSNVVQAFAWLLNATARS